MFRARVIPTLLINERSLIKTIKFDNPRYLGDPINAIKIFNEKSVDEIAIFDYLAPRKNLDPDFEFIRQLSEECFMPFAYGGGINSLEKIERIIKNGAEKVIINSASLNSVFIKEAVDHFGSQSIIASVDVKKKLFGGYDTFTNAGSISLGINPIEHSKNLEDLGVGEILLTSIDHEGMMNGYDLKLIALVSAVLKIPLIANGGAGDLKHITEAITSGANSIAAGSLFAYYGKHKAVLINYPSQTEIDKLLENL